MPGLSLLDRFASSLPRLPAKWAFLAFWLPDISAALPGPAELILARIARLVLLGVEIKIQDGAPCTLTSCRHLRLVSPYIPTILLFFFLPWAIVLL